MNHGTAAGWGANKKVVGVAIEKDGRRGRSGTQDAKVEEVEIHDTYEKRKFG